jgi:hypothetical protein
MTFPDDHPAPSRRPTSIWLKILGIGCGGVLVVLVIVAGLIAGNWSKLTGYYQHAKSTYSDVTNLQSALKSKYGADVNVALTRVKNADMDGWLLRVTLVNAPLMNRINMDSPDGRQAALEVATTARDSLPRGGGYDYYEVVFERESGSAGAGMTGRWSFRFTPRDLPPEKPRNHE